MNTLVVSKPRGDFVAQTVCIRCRLLAFGVSERVLTEEAKLLGKRIVLHLGLEAGILT